MGSAVASRTFAGHARCVHLRSRAGSPESSGLRDQVLPKRIELRTTVDTVTLGKQASIPPPTVKFMLDGRQLTASNSETLIEIADREGVEIPRLCYKPGMKAVGNCRACMVEIKGERVLAPACCRVAIDGMEVTTSNERARKAQHMV